MERAERVLVVREREEVVEEAVERAGHKGAMEEARVLVA